MAVISTDVQTVVGTRLLLVFLLMCTLWLVRIRYRAGLNYCAVQVGIRSFTLVLACVCLIAGTN